EDVGLTLRRQVAARDLEEVCPVDARGDDVDEDLARAGYRVGAVVERERGAVGDMNSLHRPMVPHGSRVGADPGVSLPRPTTTRRPARSPRRPAGGTSVGWSPVRPRT